MAKSKKLKKFKKNSGCGLLEQAAYLFEDEQGYVEYEQTCEQYMDSDSDLEELLAENFRVDATSISEEANLQAVTSAKHSSNTDVSIKKDLKALSRSKQKLEKKPGKHRNSNDPDNDGINPASELALAKLLANNSSIGIYENQTLIREGYIYKPLTSILAERVLRQHCTEKVASSYTMSKLDGVIERVKTLDEVFYNKLEIPETYVACTNGVFDVKTGKQVTLKSSDYLSFEINAEWNPKLAFSDTPVFDKFIEDCADGDPSVANLLLKFLAYLLLPKNVCKHIFVLGTAGNSGKSIIGRLISRLITEDAISTVGIHDFGKNYGPSMIVGCALNLAMDIPAGALTRSANCMLKNVSGQDKIFLEKKYIQCFKYLPFCKMVFASNFPITLTEDDAAFWDRILILPFTRSIPRAERDIRLLDKLWEERDAIVNKLFIHARWLINNNFIFPDCRKSERMKAMWRGEPCTGLAEFVETCCILDPDAQAFSRDLYEAYQSWCFQVDLKPSSRICFYRTLRKQGYDLQDIRPGTPPNQHRGVGGLGLL